MRAPILVEARPNARWSVDFIHDQLSNGRRFRILNVIDDVTKECLAAIADTSISGRRAARELDAVVAWRGNPELIVSDHGTEFTSTAMLAWAQSSRVAWHFIAPGKPMQNGVCEAFNDAITHSPLPPGAISESMVDMDRSDLQQLSKEQLIELVLRLQRPDKNSRTSSKPPSTDKKERRENSRPGGAKLGHEPHNRRLADNPDEFRDHMPSVCEACGGAFSLDAERELIGEYDEIEIPPVKPYVIRHRRFACRCGHCGVAAKAPAPAVATTTPFGPRIHALAIYLKGFQALSYERLRGLFGDGFGLDVSEGALMNMFIRSHAKFQIEASRAKAILRAAKIVASDETGVRIEGTNSYHWVFHCKDAVVHQPDYSRAARVVDEMMAGHEPEVWISDRYSAQQKHGERHQTCLAHLARDAAFAFEHGSDDLPFRFKLWLQKAFDLARAIADFAASTLARKKRELEKQLEVLLASPTGCDLARELQAKIGRARDQLLTFCDYPGQVDPTNNTSERKLRPCVIQRKVTNGYRAMWAAEAEADVRTTVDTARLNGANRFDVILAALA